MVSRRKSEAPNEQPQQAAEAAGVPAEGTNPAAGTVNVAVNEPEPPAKPPRKRAPSRRTSNRPAKADSPSVATTPGPSGRQGNGHAEGDHAALLRAIQELSHGHHAHSAEMAREFQEIKALVRSLRQAMDNHEGRLQILQQDSQETQTQLLQHSAQLNELVQLGQAADQDEEDVWDRLAALSEEFRQASDRLLERMAEQALRLEAKVDEMAVRLGSLQQQLDATQSALQENRANLHAVRTETLAAAEQLEGIQRECLDTTEMLQAARQEIRAAKDEVEATGDAAMEAALQLEESRLRMQDTAKATTGPGEAGKTSPAESETASPEPAPPPAQGPNGDHGKLGLTVDANALVLEVVPDSPAQEAGLQVGDLITAVDGQPIDKGADLPAVIRQAEAANEFTVEILRGEATQLLTVRLPTEAASS